MQVMSCGKLAFGKRQYFFTLVGTPGNLIKNLIQLIRRIADIVDPEDGRCIKIVGKGFTYIFQRKLLNIGKNIDFFMKFL